MTRLWSIDGLQHSIQPHLASGLTREADGEAIPPAALSEWDAYPVLAVCLTCREPIRCRSLYSAWAHWEAVE